MTLEILTYFQVATALAVIVASGVWAWFFAHRGLESRRRARDTRVEVEPLAFLFEGTEIVDMSASGQRLWRLARDGAGSDLDRLIGLLAPLYPDLRTRVLDLDEGSAVVPGGDGIPPLALARDGARLRVSVASATGVADAGRTSAGNHAILDATLAREVVTLRLATDALPMPVWQQTAEGTITWANAAYRALEAGSLGAAQPGAGPRPVFDIDPAAMDDSRRIERRRLDLPGEDAARWFEFAVERIGDQFQVAAFPADRLVQAERGQRDFVQTLTQTFAHLQTGLAVFSCQRELTMFNPALADMLDLPPEFLVQRPTLFKLFDRLREKRTIPEPRDYKTWCRRMSELEAAAAGGVHQETWTLTDGRTYRVTGRPHPEGAVAFLFEDISPEITLKRAHREEVQVTRAVLNNVEDAIAVFDTSGRMTMANTAYRALWHDGDPPGEQGIVEATRLWQAACHPSPVWGDVRDFAATIGERAGWSAEVRRADGRTLSCRFAALPGGSTLVAFGERRARRKALYPVDGRSASG